MTELAYEYALQRWGGAAEFHQAAGLDGRLPARATPDDGAGVDTAAVPGCAP